MEQVGTETAGVTRGLNVVYVLPPDWTRAASFLTPAVERVDSTDPITQLLIVAPDAEAAMALASAAARPGVRAVAATSVARAVRVLRAEPAQVVAGDAATLVGLLQQSALKLAGIRQVVIAWPDDVLEQAAPALEAVMAEVPKEAARTLVVRDLSPAIEQIIERYARRARRVLPAAAPDATPKAWLMEYLAVHDATRVVALRRVLDVVDPATAFVFVRDEHSRSELTAALATLGYAATGAVRAGSVLDADAELVVLFDLPATAVEIGELMARHAARRVVALVQPRQLQALRDAAGGTVQPFVLPDALVRARSREEKLRDALRQQLANGEYAREALALEPLLAEFDGIEIAAAAVRLLEAERAAALAPAASTPPRMKRLFINAGETDGIRAGDLVGAIANLGGLTGRDVGRVELRDRHALVEVPELVAAEVAAKLTGVTIKGRQLVARLDEERAARPDRGDRGDRGAGGDRGSRGAGGNRGAGGDRGDRGDRSSRSGPPRPPRKKEDRGR